MTSFLLPPTSTTQKFREGDMASSACGSALKCRHECALVLIGEIKLLLAWPQGCWQQRQQASTEGQPAWTGPLLEDASQALHGNLQGTTLAPSLIPHAFLFPLCKKISQHVQAGCSNQQQHVSSRYSEAPTRVILNWVNTPWGERMLSSLRTG